MYNISQTICVKVLVKVAHLWISLYSIETQPVILRIPYITNHFYFDLLNSTVLAGKYIIVQVR